MPAETPAPENEAGATSAASMPIDLGLKASEVEDQFLQVTSSGLGINSAQLTKAANPETFRYNKYSEVEESSTSYSPRDQAQDNARQTITLWLIGLFSVLIVMSFVALFIVGLKSQEGFNEKFFQHLKTLLDVLLGPVITLLSSAIGFYFGYQQGTTSPKDGGPKPRLPVRSTNGS